MELTPLGDRGYIIRGLKVPSYQAALCIEEACLPGVREVVASYETVGLYVDPDEFSEKQFRASFRKLKLRDATHGKRHEIPVCYEMGPDLEDTAKLLKISPEKLIEHHTAQEYRCYAIGFCPGFPYLGYLPEQISGTPRRSQPRVRVEPGSVGITGKQTAIYPLERPGGWALIGKTPLRIVDPTNDYFPIAAGDIVQFKAVSLEDYQRLSGEKL